MKRTVKRLMLKRETVRTLQDADLRVVVGGTNVVEKVNAGFKRDVSLGPCSVCICHTTSTQQQD